LDLNENRKIEILVHGFPIYSIVVEDVLEGSLNIKFVWAMVKLVVHKILITNRYSTGLCSYVLREILKKYLPLVVTQRKSIILI
jgi:hypothetical protein